MQIILSLIVAAVVVVFLYWLYRDIQALKKAVHVGSWHDEWNNLLKRVTDLELALISLEMRVNNILKKQKGENNHGKGKRRSTDKN